MLPDFFFLFLFWLLYIEFLLPAEYLEEYMTPADKLNKAW